VAGLPKIGFIGCGKSQAGGRTREPLTAAGIIAFIGITSCESAEKASVR